MFKPPLLLLPRFSSFPKKKGDTGKLSHYPIGQIVLEPALIPASSSFLAFWLVEPESVTVTMDFGFAGISEEEIFGELVDSSPRGSKATASVRSQRTYRRVEGSFCCCSFGRKQRRSWEEMAQKRNSKSHSKRGQLSFFLWALYAPLYGTPLEDLFILAFSLFRWLQK